MILLGRSDRLRDCPYFVSRNQTLQLELGAGGVYDVQVAVEATGYAGCGMPFEDPLTPAAILRALGLKGAPVGAAHAQGRPPTDTNGRQSADGQPDADRPRQDGEDEPVISRRALLIAVRALNRGAFAEGADGERWVVKGLSLTAA